MLSDLRSRPVCNLGLFWPLVAEKTEQGPGPLRTHFVRWKAQGGSDWGPESPGERVI